MPAGFRIKKYHNLGNGYVSDKAKKRNTIDANKYIISNLPY